MRGLAEQHDDQPTLAAPRRRPLGRLAGAMRRHWLFLLVMACGAAVRWLVQVTYEPAILFFDSFTYLEAVTHLEPGTPRPAGYPVLMLRPLLAFHDLALIPAVQHLLGLGMAAGIYAMLAHRGIRRWVAALAITPVLFDGYELQIEHNIASDTLFMALVVGALVLLSWRRRPSPAAAAAAGLLLGTAATVRFVGLPLLAVPLVYAVVASRGWRPRVVSTGLLAATAAVPLLIYSGWTYQRTGEFRPGSDTTSGRTLYARTAPLADCKELARTGPRYLVQLCPRAPLGLRREHPRFWMHRTGPDRDFVAGLPPGVGRYDALRQFGVQVARNQPRAVASAVAEDFLRGFSWARWQPLDTWPLEVWRFDTEVKDSGLGVYDTSETVRHYGGEGPSVDPGPARFLRDYQSVVYTRGGVFLLGAAAPLVALAAAVLGGVRQYRMLWPALLVSGTGLVLLLAAAAFAFSWRYQLPSIPLLPWAAVLGLAALFPRALCRSRETP